MMVIDEQFKIGELVYLKTDPNQEVRMVIGYVLRYHDILIYTLSCGDNESNHYDLEISTEKNILIRN